MSDTPSTPTTDSDTDARELTLVSWNVNGLRAVLKKEPSFAEIFNSCSADVFAIQETKLHEGQVDLDIPGYVQTWSFAKRKGYSGTAVFSREEPLQVVRQIGSPVAEDEGRVCALEFTGYWFVNVYTPNSKNGLARLDERMLWDERYRSFLAGLAKEKPVVSCGDFNVAHEEIDLKNPDTTTRTQVSRIRSARASRAFWTLASRTASVSSIPIERMPTAGGATACAPARETWVGASTTSL